jgi:MoxR-like ATPase
MPEEEFRTAHADAARERWRALRQIRSERARQKAGSFILPATDQCRELVLAVNAALALRRPLLVTGQPGSGKTSLAYVLADWLGLGPVLEWLVSPGAQLADALATYNPLARLQDLEMASKRADLNRKRAELANQAGGLLPGELEQLLTQEVEPLPVERFVRLGPVGTAFLPAPLPRLLLIDEIDKGDLNLANELLHLFEEGKFSISELQRAEHDRNAADRGQSPSSDPGQPATTDQGRLVDSWDVHQNQPVPARIFAGQVQCHEFPLVVMTSNGERDFPPAFNRRCLRVVMPDFSRTDHEILQRIVASHLERDDSGATRDVDAALEIFAQAVDVQKSQGDVLATDQLLNLAFLMDGHLPREQRGSLAAVLLQGLNSDLPRDADGEDDGGWGGGWGGDGGA